MLMAALLVAACVTLTPEEKAARDAAVKEGVKTAVASQKFKINVTSVTPDAWYYIDYEGYVVIKKK